MARTPSLDAQRRELSYILHRLTAYSTLADRDILERRLKDLLVEDKTNAFYEMVEDCFERLRLNHPMLVDEARGYFFGLLSEAKYELRSPTETVTMMTVGLSLSSIFKIEEPDTVISEAAAEKLVEVLKRHYINPKARIVIHHELLRSNQGPITNTELGRPLLKRMMAAKGPLYTEEHLAVAEQPVDPILSQEEDRNYGLYLFHLVLAVSVPAGELTVIHPYSWTQAPSDQKTALADADGNPYFDPNHMIQNPWCREATEALFENTRNYNAIFTEPFPIIRGVDFLEQVMSPFRIFPLVMNAVNVLNCLPRDISVSIALFCSRPDSKKIYAQEIRIAIAHAQDKEHPFSGDCITLHDTEQNVNVVSHNLEAVLKSIGVNQIVFHQDYRFFEDEEPRGRIFVNAYGISVSLSSLPEIGIDKVPENLLN